MKFLLSLLCCLCIFLTTQAENKLLQVFVDCSNGGNCYPEFIRQEIPLVNFVRDRLDADIHIVVTNQYNANQAGQYQLRFIGRNNFINSQDTIHYLVPPNSSDDEIRKLFVHHLKLGLVPFLTQLHQTDQIDITFKSTETPENTQSANDPWNYWVFKISANGSVDGNQNYFSGSGNFNITADRETEESKSNVYVSNSREIQKYNDQGTVYKYSFQSYNAGCSHNKKIREHWALGASLDATNSLFSNYKYRVQANIQSEYSVFPYKDFNNKRFVFLYSAGPSFNQYYDSTIYLKENDFFVQQSVGSIFSFIQPTGGTHIGIFWNNYIPDFSKNNLAIYGAIQYRIAKGLNFAIWGNYSFVHDQINIRKGDIDLNQLLVRNQELLSSYNYNLGMGVSYRFGSKNNSAVNPSFRGLNYSINL